MSSFSTLPKFSESQLGELPPVVLTWKDAKITTNDDQKRVLLHATSGRLQAGVTAVMGPTGAGKTSLLNALAGIAGIFGTIVEGEVRLNGQLVTPATAKNIISHVPQIDLLNGHLTVWETLMFAADMQLGFMTTEQREHEVMTLLKELGIDHVRHTLVGTPTVKGISGGQRKRVCVAIGILRRPRVLVLDEPTCGLDSVTALRLLQMLQNLARRGTIVVLAIHQPQEAIFNLFDTLILIRNGRVIYQNAASECLPFFDTLGHLHDGVTSSADHIMEVITPGLGETFAEMEKHCRVLEAHKIPTVDVMENSQVALETAFEDASWIAQTAQLTKKFLLADSRKIGLHFTNLFATLGCSLLIAGAYYNIPWTQLGVRRRLPLMFFCVVNQSLFGAMKVILSFPDERALMLKERRIGLYRSSAFMTAFCIADFVYAIPWPFLFAIPVMWMSNMAQTAGHYFFFVLILYLDKIAATSMAIATCSIAKTASAAILVLPFMIEVARLFSGFFLTPKQAPLYYSWIEAFSYVKYAFVGLAHQQLKDQTFDCARSVNATTGATIVTCDPTVARSGNELIATNGYDFLSPGGCVGILITFIFVVRFVAYLALRFLKA